MSDETGRVLALDLGEVRIGLALSDPLGITAQPAGTMQRRGKKQVLGEIRALVKDQTVVRIVVGHPLLMSGESGSSAEAAEVFARQLGEAIPGVDVELWDERLTTAEAERVMIAADVSRAKRRRKIDTLAAVLILQSYLDAHGRASS